MPEQSALVIAARPLSGETSSGEVLSRGARAVAAAYIVAAMAYLGWRPTTFNDDALLFSVVIYAAELFGFGLSILHLAMTWRLTQREPPPPEPGLAVDVFIPTINEPVDLVRRTVMAAMRMDYPHLTWLLDDGNRPAMRALAAELGCRYLARSDNIHAKAGNLNHALAHSAGGFVALFDADHAPRRDFLTRTLGYFRDPRVAFVQTPQDFFNLDSYEHRQAPQRQRVWMEQSFFWRVIQRGKDWWNAAFFCGSCAVMRRSALDDAGGIATGSVTEDLHTSLRIHKKGWRSVYHAEPLAFGVAPASIQQYLRQRLRWGQGAMQVLRRERILFARGLSAGQRLCYLATLGAYLDGWQKLVFYLAPAFVLLTGIMPVADLGAEFFARFIPYYLLTFLMFEEMGRGFGRALLVEQYNMARFAAFLLATLGFFRKSLRFDVTSKLLTADGERGLLLMLPQILVLAANVLAIPLGVALNLASPTLPASALVANIVWASVNAGLAVILLRFSRDRLRYRRGEYRFPIPLPARIHLTDGAPVFGIIDDISGDGFSFYGRASESIAPGDVLRIEIFLPTTSLSVDAAVRSLRRGGEGDQHYVKAIGCSFIWADRDQQDQLAVFLYASDVQWKLNGLGEQAVPPLQRLRRWLSGVAEDTAPAPRWASAMVLEGEGPEEHEAAVGIISVGGADRRLVTLKPIPEDRPIRLRIFTRSGSARFGGSARLRERISTPTQPLHHYALRLDTAPEPSAAP